MSEKKTSKGIIAVLLLLVIIFAGIAVYYATRPPPTPPTPEKPKVKVAMIIPGSIQDGGWGTMAYLATGEIARKFGVETSYSEWISAADAERVAREYIAAGYNVVIFHGGEYIPVGEKLAPQFSDVAFVIPGLQPWPYDNVWTVIRDDYRGQGYQVGALMGMLTKSKKIGFVGGIEFPSTIAIVNAIYMGAKDQVPDIKLYHAIAGSFDDPIKARQIAEAQIKEGVDVIFCWVDLATYGVVEAAKAAPHHVWLIGIDIDKYGVDPERFVTTVLGEFGKLYGDIVEQVIAGKSKGSVKVSEYLSLAPTRGLVPKEIEDKVFELDKKVKTGEISVPEITDRYIVPPP
ncbi:MAG: BMP family protein [Candidatus Bathyarchaeia archaeon]